MDINLGDDVRDTVTGFRGVVVCVSEWLYGCRRITLQPRELKDGKPLESQTFDEPQLEVMTKAAVKRGSRDIGGPRPEPQRR